MDGLRIELLGAPRVEVDGAPLDVDTRKAIALLARLVVGGTTRREVLTTLLWPDSDETRGRAALRRTLSALNKALDHRWVDADRREIRLVGEDVWSDVAAFEALRTGVSDHDHDPTAACVACVDALEEAVDLHRGGFLVGFALRDTAAFDDWCAAESERFQRELCATLDRLIQVRTRRGDLDAAARRVRHRLDLEPLHEPSHRRLMLLHAWRGQRGAAMRQYRECVAVLERELGVQPLERTIELHEAIVAGRPPDPPSPAPIRPPSPPVRTRPAAVPLVGRDQEVATLRAAHAAAQRAGHLIVVEGEAGIGKTRLIAELVGGARDAGARTASIRCYEEEQGVAYGAVAEVVRAATATDPQRLAAVPSAWLREAARLAPELLAQRPDLEPHGSLDTHEARRRFFEALRQVVAAGLGGDVPGLLVVDDAHWADEASQDALAYLLRRISDLPVCVVLAWRSELLSPDHRLRRLTIELAAGDDASNLVLERFGEQEISALTEAMDVRLTPDLEARLVRESEGLPLFAVEYLRVLADGTASDPWTIPAGIREIIEDHLKPLSDTARQILSAAAVIGRSFELDPLLETSGRDVEEAITALEELTAADIVAEVGAETQPRYDFRHDKLRAVMYEQTSAARRRLLHGRVADALRTRRRRGTDARPSAGLLAHHLGLAGRREEAALAHATAAEEALALSAHVEAIEHLRTAVDLGHPEPTRLHEALGDLLTLRGDYPGALHAYDTAAAQTDDGEDLARIEHHIATVHERRGDWASATAHIEAGLAALPAEDTDALRGRLHTDRALVAHRREEPGSAASEAERALKLATAADDDTTRAQALNLLGMLARARGDAAEAVAYLEDSLALAEELDDPTSRVAALNNLALAYADRGDHAAGLELAKSALGLCRRVGDRHREAAILNNLGDLLHRADQHDEALAYVKRAVAIFSEIGEPERHEPEIWKLVDW